ncbi:MAG: glutamine synthetase family protein [Pseudomonadota bacterium]
MTAIFDEPKVGTIANYELNAIMRGRSFPIERQDDCLTGLPWVPANICLSPSNTIPPDNPFGPMGETKVVPDLSTRMVFPAREDRPAMALWLCDILTHDRKFWEGCPRMQLKRALNDLKAKYGLTLRVGFEHECYIHGLEEAYTPAFSLAGARKVSGLAAEVQQILGTANTRLDQFVAEFGENQFEISSPVRPALVAADHAVLAREAIRDAARGRGAHATFAPKPDVTKPGSGVHIHFSLWDDAGAARTAHAGAMTATSGSFTAGIVKYLEAIMAYTTPSPNSFQRIAESSWVGVYACFGVRNREAAIRLCPRNAARDGSHPAASLEFRLCDGSSNPYLALAAIVRAGMMGLAEALDPPASVEQDPARIPEADRQAMGLRRVPKKLKHCLAAAAPLAPEWFGDLFWAAYDSVRRNEISDAQSAGASYPAQLARAI